MLSSHAVSPRSLGKRSVGRFFGGAIAAAVAAVAAVHPARADVTGENLQALVPELEKQVVAGMRAFSVPGLAVGIVFEDRLIYSKGFGLKSIAKADTVTSGTIFQIGSTTKAFLATTIAQAVDAGKLK